MKNKNMELPNSDYYYSYAKIKTDWSKGDLKKAIDFIREKSAGGEIKSVLEVGCGRADFLTFIPQDVQYSGVDTDKLSIEANNKKYPNSIFKVSFAEELPFANNYFDLVFSHQVLEMLHDPREGLSEMIRVVRPGGYIIIIAPNLEAPWSEVHAVRHYTKLQHEILFFQRCFDLFFRMFGKLRFRVLRQSYTEATGKFEKSDDDLKYMVSAYEVAAFLKNQGLVLIYDKKYQAGSSLKSVIKVLIAKLPAFRYYGGGTFLIAKNDYQRRHKNIR